MFKLFKKIEKALDRQEKDVLAGALKENFAESKYKITKGIDTINHYKQRLENERYALMSKAERLKNSGRINDAVPVLYQISKKDQAIAYLAQRIEALSMHESEFDTVKTEIETQDIVSKATRKNEILSKDTLEMVKRYSKLKEREDSYADMDLGNMERILDTPFYNPAMHNEDYQATRYNLESIVAATPAFQNYLNAFRSDLIPVKENR